MKSWGFLLLLFLLLIEKCWQWFAFPAGIIASYADDFLLIPLVMGAALWVQQKYISPKFVYSILQIFIIWFACCLIFEGLFPILWPAYTRDLWDFGAYALGAFYFYLLLNYPAVKIKS